MSFLNIHIASCVRRGTLVLNRVPLTLALNAETHPMNHRSSSSRFVAVLLALAAITGAAGVLSANNGTTKRGTDSIDGVSTLDAATPPRDLDRLIRSAGITPEGFAAAGFTSNQCDLLFNVALAHSFGNDRLGQFEVATRNLNIASDNAAMQPDRRRSAPDGSQVPTAAQARAALDELRSQVFNAITATLPADRVLVARRIAENQRHWDLPVQYLAVDRTDEQRAALRSALNTMALAAKRNQPVNQASAAIIAAEDRDPAVQAAAANLASGLALIRENWDRRSTTPTVP